MEIKNNFNPLQFYIFCTQLLFVALSNHLFRRAALALLDLEEEQYCDLEEVVRRWVTTRLLPRLRWVAAVFDKAVGVVLFVVDGVDEEGEQRRCCCLRRPLRGIDKHSFRAFRVKAIDWQCLLVLSSNVAIGTITTATMVGLGLPFSLSLFFTLELCAAIECTIVHCGVGLWEAVLCFLAIISSW